MNRLKLVLAAVALAVLVPAAARASCASLALGPIANGQANNAGPVVTAFNTLFTCSTTVDNTQIGVLGIFASQIIPTSLAQATFGGSTAYAFNNQLQVNSGNDGVISELVFGHSITQSQPIQQWWNFPSGTELFEVGATGTATIQTSTDASFGLIINGAADNGQTAPLLAIFKKTGGTQLALINADGSIDSCPTFNLTNQCAPDGPVYTSGGGSAGSSFHWDKPFAFVTDLNGACGAGASCVLDNATISLAGQGAFSDATFQCIATDAGAGASFNFGAVPASSSSITMHVRNVTNGSIGDEASVIATVICGGS